MAQQISEKRQTAFTLGTGLIIVGGLLFASTFISFVARFGDFTNFEARTQSGMFRALGGIGLILVGGWVRGIGARGLAGSGVVLDPAQAREDLEPYSRMAGGMVKDALQETGLGQSKTPETIIKIKCLSCGALNPEDANFCHKCGKPLSLGTNA
ncbi:MAG: zinc-ribbon domain-containing protein [Candidatus Methylacidiphilales bacterium]|nr:zinc-ribbon domain-containing protein [Candidatus Methylacidiphilales bacterium]